MYFTKPKKQIAGDISGISSLITTVLLLLLIIALILYPMLGQEKKILKEIGLGDIKNYSAEITKDLMPMGEGTITARYTDLDSEEMAAAVNASAQWSLYDKGAVYNCLLSGMEIDGKAYRSLTLNIPAIEEGYIFILDGGNRKDTYTDEEILAIYDSSFMYLTVAVWDTATNTLYYSSLRT